MGGAGRGSPSAVDQPRPAWTFTELRLWGYGRVTLVDGREAVDDPVLTAQRTVASLRRWVALDRDRHLPDLAGAVNNLAVDLSEAARPNEAL
ncbi:MAG: hypothetical protein QOG96_2698, partial [Pseudonocardiales bacterium]|nr:hypothetical protein [Pseudonocardiales bacterium]